MGTARRTKEWLSAAGALCAIAACGPRGHVVVSTPLGGDQTETEVAWRVWSRAQFEPRVIALVNVGDGEASIDGAHPVDGDLVSVNGETGPFTPFGATPTFEVSMTPMKLAPGATSTLKVQSPGGTEDAPARATIDVDLGNADPGNVRLHLEAVAFDVACPTTLEYPFGTVKVGQTATQSFKFTNPSGEDLRLRAGSFDDSGVTATQPFATSPEAGVLIAPGQEGELEITFKPTESGSWDTNARLVIGRFCENVLIHATGEGVP